MSRGSGGGLVEVVEEAREQPLPGRLIMLGGVVVLGPPGAGKTTRARHLEEHLGALRLTPDEWMIPLFGRSQPEGRRDVLEGRLLWTALRAAERA